MTSLASTAAEIRALRGGDIPIFTTRPDSPDVWLDNGDRVAAVLPTTPIEVVRDRIRRMDGTDLAFQRRMIETSYDLAQASQQSRPVPATPRIIPPEGVSSEELVERAEEIGRRLVKLALRDGERIGWLGLSWVEEHYWKIEPAGPGLYQGLPGMGMLLTYLAAETERPFWTDQARLVADTVAVAPIVVVLLIEAECCSSARVRHDGQRPRVVGLGQQHVEGHTPHRSGPSGSSSGRNTVISLLLASASRRVGTMPWRTQRPSERITPRSDLLCLSRAGPDRAAPPQRNNSRSEAPAAHSAIALRDFAPPGPRRRPRPRRTAAGDDGPAGGAGRLGYAWSPHDLRLRHFLP